MPPAIGQLLRRVRRTTPERAIEWFVLANLAFLGLDIAIAHQANRFRERSEWAPVVFSAAATLLLVPTAIGVRHRVVVAIDRLVASAAIAVGVIGMVLHLESAFFEEQTLRNLVYSAPFVAPLSYVGVGLLLWLIRSEPPASPALGPWIVLLTLGGFVGNFALSLLDHAQNAFFRWTEWIPVFGAALAIGFLLMLLARPGRVIVRATAVVLAIAAAIGVLGFLLHVLADAHRPDLSLASRFVFGAPAFAPLLFANLALLGGIGLWALGRYGTSEAAE